MVDVSFIVVNFNNSTLISKCISSIMLINNFSYEIIIVDDHSTDKSKEIINNIYNKNANNFRIQKILLEKNIGTFNSRKIGAFNSAGNYIFFIDSDDWVIAKNCEGVEKYFNSYDLISTKLLNYYTKSTKKYKRKSLNPYKKELFESNIFYKFIERKWGPIGQLPKFIKKNIVIKTYKEIGNIDIKLNLGEDQLFNIICIYFCNSYKPFHNYFYCYNRTNLNSITIKKINLHDLEWSMQQTIFIYKKMEIFFCKKNINKNYLEKWMQNQILVLYGNVFNSQKFKKELYIYGSIIKNKIGKLKFQYKIIFIAFVIKKTILNLL